MIMVAQLQGLKNRDTGGSSSGGWAVLRLSKMKSWPEGRARSRLPNADLRCRRISQEVLAA